MSSQLVLPAIALANREQAHIVAATGLFFKALSTNVPTRPIKGVLESYRGGVWGEEAANDFVGYPVLRSTNMRGVKMDVSHVAWRSVRSDQAEKCKLITGDILVSKASGSSDLVGKAAIFTHPGDGRTYLFSNFLLRLRPDAKKVLPEYLAWFLRSPQSLAWRFDTQQTTVGLRNLKTNAFLNQMIPLANEKNQRAIVKYLNTLERGATDKAIKVKLPPPLSEQQPIVAKIEQLAAKIEEVRWLRRNVLEQSSALASSLHFSLSQNRVAELAQLLELDEHREAVLPNVEYPQIGIRGFGGGLFIKSAVRGTETTYRYFNRLEAGQVILSQVKGWEGAVAVSRAEHAGFFVSPEYRTFRCIAGMCDPAYMDNVVISPWFHALLAEATRGQGARRERTRPELFLRIKIPMPHYESQRRAVAILNRVRMVPQLQSETSAELDALLPSILDKAFKGEL